MARKTKFYAAGSMKKQSGVNDCARQIQEITGWQFTSRWHVPGALSGDPNIFARENLADLRKAKRMIWFAGEPFSSGKHFELGYAWKDQWPIHVVVPPWSSITVKEACGFIPPDVSMPWNRYIELIGSREAYLVDQHTPCGVLGVFGKI